jgi:hypothetical protein
MANILPTSPDAANSEASEVPEVEFALVLQRIINSVSDDPVQLRHSIYELARMKLRKETFGVDAEEMLRLTNALETAIKGVEVFSQRSPALRLDLSKSLDLRDSAVLPSTPPSSPQAVSTWVNVPPTLIEGPAQDSPETDVSTYVSRRKKTPVNSRSETH